MKRCCLLTFCESAIFDVTWVKLRKNERKKERRREAENEKTFVPLAFFLQFLFDLNDDQRKGCSELKKLSAKYLITYCGLMKDSLVF